MKHPCKFSKHCTVDKCIRYSQQPYRGRLRTRKKQAFSHTTSTQVVNKYSLVPNPSMHTFYPWHQKGSWIHVPNLILLTRNLGTSVLASSDIKLQVNRFFFFHSIRMVSRSFSFCFWVANFTSQQDIITLTLPDPCCAVSLPTQTSSKIEGSCHQRTPSSFSQKYNLLNQCRWNDFPLSHGQREQTQKLTDDFKKELCFKGQLLHCKQLPACK